MSAVELDDADVALILEALEDAAVYRDARSRVLDMAVRRQARRGSAPAATGGGVGAEHEKAKRYPGPPAPVKDSRETQGPQPPLLEIRRAEKDRSRRGR